MSAELQAKFDHGTENEANAIATFASVVVPLLYEASYVFEEGCTFISENNQKLMVVSPDGTLRTPNHDICAVLEVKCPVSADYKLPVHYTVPKYYICQLLAEMAAMQVSQAIYICYSSESTTVCIASFDENLWEEIMLEVKRIYGDVHIENIKVPTRKSPAVSRLMKLIETFSAENVKFLSRYLPDWLWITESGYLRKHPHICSLTQMSQSHHVTIPLQMS